MSIRKRTWKIRDEVRVGWIVDRTDATGTRIKKQFSTKSEAVEFDRKLTLELSDGAFRKDAYRITVQDLSQLYLSDLKGRYERGDNVTRHYLLCVTGYHRNYILASKQTKSHNYATEFHEGIGGFKLSQVSKKVVTDFRDRLRQAGLGVATTRKVIGSLKGMFSFAAERNFLVSNPAVGVRVIGHRAEQKTLRRSAPPKWLVKALIEEAKADQSHASKKLYAALVLTVVSGIRASEMKGLRWSHVDFEAKELSIETRIDAYGEEDGHTKTAAGRRRIPLGKNTLDTLQQWRKQSAYTSQSDFVFPNRRGGPTSHDRLRTRHYYPLFERLRIRHERSPGAFPDRPSRYGWHELRHFAISTWIEQGVPLKTIMSWAGHSSVQMTMDRYGHMFKSANDWTTMDTLASALTE